MLYSLNGSYPALLPNRIRLSSGLTRTDKTTFTEEEISDAGWVVCSDSPEVLYPNVLEWTGTDWNIRAPNAGEIATKWIEIKASCQQILVDTDYKVIKSFELNVPLSQEWITYRQDIRNIYNDVNNIDPWNVAWPEAPAS